MISLIPSGPAVCHAARRAALPAAAPWPSQYSRAGWLPIISAHRSVASTDSIPCCCRPVVAAKAAMVTAGSGSQPADSPSHIPGEATTAPYREDDFVVVGTVGRAQGLKGEVRVYPVTDQPKKRLSKPGVRLWLQLNPTNGPPGSQVKRVIVQTGRIVKPATAQDREVWAVKFKDVADRTQASNLANHLLLLAVCDRENLRSSDEFFVQDLIGMKAYLQGSGQLIGVVTEVYDGTGTHDTLRLRLVPTAEDIKESQYRTVLVPFVEAIVPVVDKRAKRLELTPPEGLLDGAVARVTKLRQPYSPQQQAQLLEQLKKQQQQQQQQVAVGPAGGQQEVAPTTVEEVADDDSGSEEEEEEEAASQSQPAAGLTFREQRVMQRQKRLMQMRDARRKAGA